MKDKARLFPEGNGLVFLYSKLFGGVNFKGQKGRREKSKLYENWKMGFEVFWGWFDLVFEGFDPEKRGFEFV